MGFKIIKDNLHVTEEEKKWSLVGREYDEYKGGKNRFRLLDDDGNIYLYGLSDCDSSFAPLDTFMYAYGCTEIQYKNPETKEYETL
jgi:hypothetical protein